MKNKVSTEVGYAQEVYGHIIRNDEIHARSNTIMNRKLKLFAKVGFPLVIIIQLTSVLFMLAYNGRDKALSCKTLGEYLVCKQVEIPK